MTHIRLSEILAAARGLSWSERLAIQTLVTEDTGLPMVVLVSTREVDRYGPRVKVSLEHGYRMSLDRMVSVSVSDDPRIISRAGLSGQDLRLVRAWVLLNKDALLRYWNCELAAADMMAALRPLGRAKGRS